MTMRIGSPRTLAGALWRHASKTDDEEMVITTELNQIAAPLVPTAAEPVIGTSPNGHERHTPRPIFVIGSRRSGASMLAASLGQHPQIAAVPDTAWIERFALGLQQTYHEDALRGDLSQFTALGVDHRRLFAHFGEAIDHLLLTSGAAAAPGAGPDASLTWRSFTNGNGSGAGGGYRPTRWVDSCYTHVFNVFALHQLFPDAQFIHVVRDVEEVVASLISPSSESLFKSRHVPFTAQDAYEHWLDAVTAGLDAERAFGSRTVQRVLRSELTQDPEAVVKACLATLGEAFDDRCLRPFRAIANGAEPEPDPLDESVLEDVPAELVEQAEFLSFALDTSACSSRERPPDARRMERMQKTFSQRGEFALLPQ